ncbi:MAG: hypothetical protein ACHQZQ_08130, partial [SAR324 cluster bacterium]
MQQRGDRDGHARDGESESDYGPGLLSHGGVKVGSVGFDASLQMGKSGIQTGKSGIQDRGNVVGGIRGVLLVEDGHGFRLRVRHARLSQGFHGRHGIGDGHRQSPFLKISEGKR